MEADPCHRRPPGSWIGLVAEEVGHRHLQDHCLRHAAPQTAYAAAEAAWAVVTKEAVKPPLTWRAPTLKGSLLVLLEAAATRQDRAEALASLVVHRKEGPAVTAATMVASPR